MATDNAYAISAGDAKVKVNGRNEYALAWADGKLTGSVEAGKSASAFAYGDMDILLKGDNEDAVAVAAGDIRGSYHAGRDLGVASYGDLSASLIATEKLVWAVSRGDLTGQYVAFESVQSVFSYGTIDAGIYAFGNGSTIEEVTALGDIDGDFAAPNGSIGTVHSGGAVNASLVALQVADPIENDATLADQYPLPEVPTSDLTSVHQAAADLKSQLLVAKGALILVGQGLQLAETAFRISAADAIAKHVADVAYERGMLESDAIMDSLGDLVEDADEFAADRADAAEDDDATRQEADLALAKAYMRRQAMAAAGQAKHDEAVASRDEANKKHVAAQIAAGVDRMNRLDSMQEEKAHGTDWAAAMGSGAVRQMKSLWAGFLDVPHWVENLEQFAQATWDYFTARPKQIHDTFTAGGWDSGPAVFMTAQILAADFIGLTSISTAWWGEDPITLEEKSNTQRLFEGASGVFQLATLVYGGAKALNAVRGPCGWVVCFVAGTPVVDGIEDAMTVSVAAANNCEGNAYFALSAGTLLAAAWVALDDREKKTRQKHESGRAADKVFDFFGGEQDVPDPEMDDSMPDADLYLALAAQDRFDDTRIEAATDAYVQQAWSLADTECGDHEGTNPNGWPRLRTFENPTIPIAASAGASRSRFPATGHEYRSSQSPSTVSTWSRPATLSAGSSRQDGLGRRTRSAQSRTHRSHFRFRATLIACLLALSAVFGIQGLFSTKSGSLPSAQPTSAAVSAPKLKTTAIEKIRVGQRVVIGGANPEKMLPTAVDEGTWRHLTLEQTDTWPDGTVDRICIESILPPEWLDQYGGAPVGSTVPIPLDLEEMGLPEGMTATVLANESCPTIASGPGRVVLTTVNHLNRKVVELTLAAVDGTRETVRPTAFHKFYSESRGQWLSAQDLKPQERLRGIAHPLQVVSVRPVPGVHRVYNMTVEGEHVYHVSTLGVLAHNNGCGGVGKYSDVGGHHVHAKAGFKNSIRYNKRQGLSISQDYMKSRGWDHQAMTNKQRELFNDLAASGRPNTMKEHSRIAVEALQAGGATREEARRLVAESLRNLRLQGATGPTDISWN